MLAILNSLLFSALPFRTVTQPRELLELIYLHANFYSLSSRRSCLLPIFICRKNSLPSVSGQHPRRGRREKKTCTAKNYFRGAKNFLSGPAAPRELTRNRLKKLSSIEMVHIFALALSSLSARAILNTYLCTAERPKYFICMLPRARACNT